MNFIKNVIYLLTLGTSFLLAEQKIFMIDVTQPMVAVYDDEPINFVDNKLAIKDKINWQKPNMICTKNVILNRPDYVLGKYKNISNTGSICLLPQDKVLKNQFMIIMDAGHGGSDKGAVYHGFKEKDLSLKITKLVYQKLKDVGLPVFCTRTRDKTVSLESRVALAQQYHGLYVSIHLNSAPNKNVTGLETFWCDAQKIHWEPLKPNWVLSSKDFAQVVHQAILNKIPNLVDRGVKHGCPLVLICNLNMPAILIECGFLSNKDEAKKLANPQYQDQLAYGIAQGIQSYWHKFVI
jgi:N-acetylmuramoyl-L-alanine amidase